LDAERKKMPDLEMTIPKSRSDTVWEGVFTFIVVFFGFLGILNLTNHVAIIPSAIWLIIVMTIVWNGCREAGGIRRYLADRLAVFAGRRFVLYLSGQTGPARIRFGYQLFGLRVFQRDVQIERIECVEWTPGQTTSMAGHDMKDWRVVLWYEHCSPEKSKKDHMLRKPDQDLHIVGPSRRKEDTSAFGLEFVAFLRKAGARLIQGEADNLYVRQESEEKAEVGTSIKS
jgi:hypothetical protein